MSEGKLGAGSDPFYYLGSATLLSRFAGFVVRDQADTESDDEERCDDCESDNERFAKAATSPPHVYWVSAVGGFIRA